MVRAFWVLRAFVLRAGELTGHGGDLFFLPVEDIVAVLDGDESPLTRVPPARAAYDRYRALPAYPTLIRGRFDPVAWAADPNRWTDLYDETAEHQPMTDRLPRRGGHRDRRRACSVHCGRSGSVAGRRDPGHRRDQRRLDAAVPEGRGDRHRRRRPALARRNRRPRTRHPAVVGCGNATTRLSTGDPVRVDGNKGTVTLVEPDHE